MGKGANLRIPMRRGPTVILSHAARARCGKDGICVGGVVPAESDPEAREDREKLEDVGAHEHDHAHKRTERFDHRRQLPHSSAH